jgi:hypothetical protein
MHVTTGTFATANGSKYLQQVCKHFAHNREVAYTETEGSCRFDMGTAYLTADETGLTVRFELHNDDAFEAAQNVIDSHLERFAFREDFKRMDWDWTPPPQRRSVVGATKDLLRTRLPGLHAILQKSANRLR